jgi:hypothetical protein
MMAKGDKLHNQSRNMEMVALFCFHIQIQDAFLVAKVEINNELKRKSISTI